MYNYVFLNEWSRAERLDLRIRIAIFEYDMNGYYIISQIKSYDHSIIY